jgi:hypothetical protein
LGWNWVPLLVADQYRLLHRHRASPETAWELGTLVKQSLPWRCQGVLHEAIVWRSRTTRVTSSTSRRAAAIAASSSKPSRDESRALNERLLSEGHLPESERAGRGVRGAFLRAPAAAYRRVQAAGQTSSALAAPKPWRPGNTGSSAPDSGY